MTDLRQQLARLSPEQRAALERRVMAAEPHGAPVIPRRPDGVAAPLSAGQERLWFLQRFDPEDASYNLHLTERLRGPLDVEALQAAVDEVVTRHEVLRTRYPVVDGRPAPVVEPDARSLIDIVPVEGGPVTEREVHARRVVDELVNRPFHLDQAPLLRAVVLRIAERDHILCLVLHHIAGDGWSLNVLARELSRCYPAHRIGVAPVPPSLSLQYADFATWQRDLFAAQQDVTGERAQQLRERLSATPPLDLPSDRPRPRFRTSRGGHVRRRLGKQQTGRIAELATGERATTFMVLLASYQVLLARLCGQTDFSVGSPITGRDRPELQSLIGFFTNTLVLPSDVSGDPTFRELLARLRASTLAAYSDQETPLEQLISWSDPDRDTSRTPLFQVMLNVQPAKTGLLRLPEVTSEPWIPEFDHVKVDLELNVNSYADDLELELGYSSALFDRDTAERLCGHLATLIAAATTDPDLPISRLRLLSDAQRQQALHHGNDTASGYPQERLHELVIAQAARTPDAPAVFTSDEHVTYGELLRRVRTLAWRLRDAGVPPNTPVAVLLPRTADLVAATLAVLAAGCHYVPLEPRHPPARLREIIADSGAAAAFVTEGATDTLGAPRTIAVDEARADEPPAGVPEAPGTPDDLA
ncbi:MAG: condensation domain-containing protein, partial [Thermocrispum sp.]